MKVLQTLIFFLALQDPVADAQTNTYEGVEGGNITANCSTPENGHTNQLLRKERRTDPNTGNVLCEGACETGNSFNVSCKDTNQCERCSIRSQSGSQVVRITITNLEESDSGNYTVQSCNGQKESCTFEICVKKASTITQTTDGTATIGTQQSSTHPEQTATIETQQSSTHPGVSQILAPILVTIVIIIISVALMIYCKKRRFLQPKSAPLKTELDHGQHDNPVYEEIKDNRENKLYTEHHIQNPAPADDTTVYCVASMSQNKVEGNSTEYFTVQLPDSPSSSNSNPWEHAKSNSEYSEVQYSNRTLPSPSSCDKGTSDSAAPTEENSTDSTDGAPASLYPDLPS